MKKITVLLLVFAMMICAFAACSSKDKPAPETPELSTANIESTTEEASSDHPRVKVKMESGGEFIIELYPEYAPKTVENFLSLVESGFYDGLTFHRVMKDFMAQGGDPEGTGFGGSKKTIKGEFSANGFTQNVISHTRGVVSMARGEDNDSASSQFFICYSDRCTFLDGQYAAFGKVIEGMEVVDSFADVKMAVNSFGEEASPVDPIYIKSVTVM